MAALRGRLNNLFNGNRWRFWLWAALALVNGLSFAWALEYGVINGVSLAMFGIAYAMAVFYA